MIPPPVQDKDSCPCLSPGPGSRTVQLASWRDGWAARQAAASLLASAKSRPWKIMEPARALDSRSTYVTSILHMAQLQIQLACLAILLFADILPLLVLMCQIAP